MTPRSARLLLLAAFVILSAYACVPKKPGPAPVEPPPALAINADALDVDTAYARGMDAYWKGDYKTASVLFDSLAKRPDDHPFRARSLFALACAMLAGAQTQADYVLALAAWNDWEAASSGPDGQADPRMLTPFLRGAKLFTPARDAREPKPQVSQAKPAPSDADLSRRLQEKEKEVLTLQKQLKALEAIHREIQEKKKMSVQ
jgi:hypothetical protein